MVWDWSNGDVVCRACGLVAQERIIDDRDTYRNREEFSPVEIEVSKKTIQQTNALNATLFNGMMEDATDMAKVIDEFCNREIETSSILIKEEDVSKKAEIASCVYANTKGIPTKDLCVAMNVKPKQLWKAAVKHNVINTNRTNDLLKRTVYECDEISAGREWEVLKVAKQFLTALNTTSATQSIKPERLVVSLMILACEVLKVGNINRATMCRKYGLSKDTLYRHEAMVQEALTKQS